MTVIRPLARRRRRQLIIVRAECFRVTLPPRKPPWLRSRLSRLSRIYRVAAFAQSLSRDHLGSSGIIWNHLSFLLHISGGATHTTIATRIYTNVPHHAVVTVTVFREHDCVESLSPPPPSPSAATVTVLHTRCDAPSPFRRWDSDEDEGASTSGDEDWAQLAVIHTGTRGTSYIFSGHWCSPVIFREAMRRATCRNGYQCTRMSFFFFPFLYCSRVPSRRADDYGYLL